MTDLPNALEGLVEAASEYRTVADRVRLNAMGYEHWKAHDEAFAIQIEEARAALSTPPASSGGERLFICPDPGCRRISREPGRCTASEHVPDTPAFIEYAALRGDTDG